MVRADAATRRGRVSWGVFLLVLMAAVTVPSLAAQQDVPRPPRRPAADSTTIIAPPRAPLPVIRSGASDADGIPQGFTARVVGQQRVMFFWNAVAKSAGVAVYNARTGEQLSAVVTDTTWLSPTLAPGTYTFVAAPWLAGEGKAPPHVGPSRSQPVVVTIR